MFKYRQILFFLAVVFISSGCALLEAPPRPVIPTPIPTVPPINTGATGELVIDPVSDVVPAVDPFVEALMNEVSQNQLVGYVQQLQSFGTRNTFSPTDRTDFGLGAARTWIFNEFVRVGNGRLQVEYDPFPLNYNGTITDQQNVVATLPGTGSYPGVVVLMAHYDSRSVDPNDGTSLAPGANDNASGVAAMLEIARLLSSRNWNQTVVFIAFTAEEQGTYGSRHFVADRLLDGWQIDAAINMDIVGGRPGIPQSIRMFAAGPDTTPQQQLARYIDFVGALYAPQFPPTLVNATDREGRFSDHIRFLDAGIPAVRMIESVEDPSRQHNALDTADAIDYNYLRQVTQLNLAVLANIIGAPTPAQPPIMAPMADPGGIILSWNPDPLAAGYAISFRPLGAEDYPPFRFVSGNQAGNVAITGLDTSIPYAVSIAAISPSGLIGKFSPEIILEAQPTP